MAVGIEGLCTLQTASGDASADRLPNMEWQHVGQAFKELNPQRSIQAPFRKANYGV